MTTPLHFDNTKGSWTFIAPVNLQLTSAVKDEFEIGEVLFVDRAKLPRIRRRLGIRAPLSRLKKPDPEDWYTRFFAEAPAYAIMTRRGTPKTVERDCFRRVRDALSLLALSQLGYARRRAREFVTLYGEHGHSRVERVILNRTTPAKSIGGRITRSSGPLVLTGLWLNFMRKGFFIRLLRLLYTPGLISSSWRDDLNRAALLIGKGFNTLDLPTAFLMNVSALETLLSRQGDRQLEVLPKRIEAFLGWVGFWATDRYEERIQEIYKKRSALVHAGQQDIIAPQDLLFTDDLLFNLLVNLVSLSDRLNSKEDILHFSRQVEAEHLLGVKPRVRPKKLVFFSRRYTEEDIGEI